MAATKNQQRYARERQEQKDQRREDILSAAEELFLEKGLENVSMKEIAEKAHISKMTLYRYFASRDPIAIEIAVKMLTDIHSSFQNKPIQDSGADPVVVAIIRMIDEFHQYEHAYRYLGMFDHLYAQNYPSDELAGRYKISMLGLREGMEMVDTDKIAFHIMLGNATMSFLEKLAARGRLLEKEQEVSIDDQLNEYKKVLTLLKDQ